MIICYGLNVCPPSPPKKSYVGNLPPEVMVLGGGAYRRQLGHEGRALMNGISVLIKEDRAPSPFCPVRI